MPQALPRTASSRGRISSVQKEKFLFTVDIFSRHYIQIASDCVSYCLGPTRLFSVHQRKADPVANALEKRIFSYTYLFVFIWH